MAEGLNGRSNRDELVRVIRDVRSRWRTKLLVTGGIAIIGGGLLALVIASIGLQNLKFSASSITGFRIATLLVFAGLVAWWFIREVAIWTKSKSTVPRSPQEWGRN